MLHLNPNLLSIHHVGNIYKLNFYFYKHNLKNRLSLHLLGAPQIECKLSWLRQTRKLPSQQRHQLFMTVVGVLARKTIKYN